MPCISQGTIHFILSGNGETSVPVRCTSRFQDSLCKHRNIIKKSQTFILLHTALLQRHLSWQIPDCGAEVAQASDIARSLKCAEGDGKTASIQGATS